MPTYPRYSSGDPTVGVPRREDRVAGLLDATIRSLFGYVDTENQRTESRRRFDTQAAAEAEDRRLRAEQRAVQSRAGAYGAVQQGMSPDVAQGIYGPQALSPLMQQGPTRQAFIDPRSGREMTNAGAFDVPPPQLPQRPWVGEGPPAPMPPGMQRMPTPERGGAYLPPAAPLAPPAPGMQGYASMRDVVNLRQEQRTGPSALQAAYEGGQRGRAREAFATDISGLGAAGGKAGQSVSKFRDVETQIENIRARAAAAVERNPDRAGEIDATAGRIIAGLQRVMVDMAEFDEREATTKVRVAGASSYRPMQVSKPTELLALSESPEGYAASIRGMRGAPTFSSPAAWSAARERAKASYESKAVQTYSRADAVDIASGNRENFRRRHVAMGETVEEVDSAWADAHGQRAGEQAPKADAATAASLRAAIKGETANLQRAEAAAGKIGAPTDSKDSIAAIKVRIRQYERQLAEAEQPAAAQPPAPAASSTREASDTNRTNAAARATNATAKRWKKTRGTGDAAAVREALAPLRRALQTSPDRFDELEASGLLSPEAAEMFAYIRRFPGDPADAVTVVNVKKKPSPVRQQQQAPQPYRSERTVVKGVKKKKGTLKPTMQD